MTLAHQSVLIRSANSPYFRTRPNNNCGGCAGACAEAKLGSVAGTALGLCFGGVGEVVGSTFGVIVCGVGEYFAGKEITESF